MTCALAGMISPNTSRDAVSSYVEHPWLGGLHVSSAFHASRALPIRACPPAFGCERSPAHVVHNAVLYAALAVAVGS